MGSINDELFHPLKLGRLTLKHRVVLAPLTRYRAPDHVPGDLMVNYYTQRTTEGGLLISEATIISDTCGVHPNNPRIDTPASIEGWKKVVDAVHDKGGFFYMQLNHYGRSGIPKYNQGKLPLCSSPIKLTGQPLSYPDPDVEFVEPKAMDQQDMNQVIEDFVNSAYNAVHVAGCDGVELHGANGYLIDEFLEDNINVRTDEYGGSIENRAKFPLAILDAVIEKVGDAKKVGFRLSPWDNFQDADDSDPVGHFSYVCQELDKRGLAYVHIIEARSDSNGGREKDDTKSDTLSEDLLTSSVLKLREFLPTTPLLSAGGWNSDNFQGMVEKGLDALVFGRYFLSTPDLVIRLQKNLPLNPYDRSTFYAHLEPRGYNDYPFWGDK